jgi:O-6-methylguanine DNA methyltransferase
MNAAFGRALSALKAAKAPAAFAAAVLERIGIGDAYVRVATDIGDVYVAHGPSGVVAVRLMKDDAAYEAWHHRRFGTEARRERKPGRDLLSRIERRISGDRRANVRIDLRGVTAFERSVLEKTREIPRGEVRPYAWIAREIGHPRAVRAVGSALSRNPVPLLIPCHRVVRSDGSAGQYIFGSAVKRALLKMEGAPFIA